MLALHFSTTEIPSGPAMYQAPLGNMVSTLRELATSSKNETSVPEAIRVQLGSKRKQIPHTSGMEDSSFRRLRDKSRLKESEERYGLN